MNMTDSKLNRTLVQDKLNLINKQLNIHNNISVLDLVKKLSKYTVFI